MSIFPKLIYRFNEIPIKIPAGFLVDTDKLILKFLCTSKGTKIAKTILKNKNKVRGITAPDIILLERNK